MTIRGAVEFAPVTVEKARQEALERNREDLAQDGVERHRRRGARREHQDRLIWERRRRQRLPRRWSQATVRSLVILAGLFFIVWFLA